MLASTSFDLFQKKEFQMIGIIVVMSITTIMFHFLFQKISNTKFAIEKWVMYDEHLQIIDKIMDVRGYSLIVKAFELERIEDKAKEIFVFTENLVTDIPKECFHEKEMEGNKNIGLFVSIVSENIPKGKKYKYFLKNNKENRGYIKHYFKYHFLKEKNKQFRENITFYLISEAEFTFFTEMYLYKGLEGDDMAFEWLPAIGEHNDIDKQFYLSLSPSQVENINEIGIEMMDNTPTITFSSYKGKNI